MRLLISEAPAGLPAGEISVRLGLPASTLSFHLAALERANLTQSTRRGRQVVHRARISGLRRLLAFLTETCCAGRPDICGDLVRLLPTSEEAPPRLAPAFNVLFLCTRNSARSIMAEAVLERVGSARFRAYSAGSHPAVRPLPTVIEKLRALGHDVSRLHSKSYDEFIGPAAPRLDFVIALCDTLRGQRCPDFAGSPVQVSWPLPDPAKFKGSAVERSTMLNELYVSLKRRMEVFANLPFASLDRPTIKRRLDEIGAGGMPTPSIASAG